MYTNLKAYEIQILPKHLCGGESTVLNGMIVIRVWGYSSDFLIILISMTVVHIFLMA